MSACWPALEAAPWFSDVWGQLLALLERAVVGRYGSAAGLSHAQLAKLGKEIKAGEVSRKLGVG